VKRRDFVKVGALGSAALITNSCSNTSSSNNEQSILLTKSKEIKVVSTWISGIDANKEAFRILQSNGSAINAIEKGLNITESDPENTSVGLGGMPDANGLVTLDASIMDHNYNCGSVTYLQNIEHPISVARKVMEETPHVMLSGKGAYEFALEQGFKHKNLLTDNSLQKWQEWKDKKTLNLPIINHENHDTIAMIAQDENGNLAAGCTTSGWAYKKHGRVGDSPIIGAGIFVDPEIGAACATGLGEAIIKICGSHTIVEQMRNGLSPEEACKVAIERIKKSSHSLDNLQVGFIAMNIAGEVGSYSMYSGFDFALHDENRAELIKSDYEFEWE
tara:strand:+ start:91 stop:1086 length:996 start_codon:yes stop_codon:yes gene_type:complete